MKGVEVEGTDVGFNNKQQGDTDRLTSPKVKENNEEERQEVSLLIVIFTPVAAACPRDSDLDRGNCSLQYSTGELRQM